MLCYSPSTNNAQSESPCLRMSFISGRAYAHFPGKGLCARIDADGVKARIVSAHPSLIRYSIVQRICIDVLNDGNIHAIT